MRFHVLFLSGTLCDSRDSRENANASRHNRTANILQLNIFFCRYFRNIKRMGDILKDEQVKPMQRAIWHVEHLLKFPDSRHFKYHGRDITWSEYYGTVLVIVIGSSTLLLLTLNLFIMITKKSVRAYKSGRNYVFHGLEKWKKM